MIVCGHENSLVEGVLYYTTKMKPESEMNKHDEHETAI
jgi:hypothetical protein